MLDECGKCGYWRKDRHYSMMDPRHPYRGVQLPSVQHIWARDWICPVRTCGGYNYGRKEVCHHWGCNGRRANARVFFRKGDYKCKCGSVVSGKGFICFCKRLCTMLESEKCAVLGRLRRAILLSPDLGWRRIRIAYAASRPSGIVHLMIYPMGI